MAGLGGRRRTLSMQIQVKGNYAATCLMCSRRMEWTGTLLERPPCPHCNSPPDPVEILQLPLQKLEERIEQELQNNPVLELTESDAEDGGAVQVMTDAADGRGEG